MNSTKAGTSNGLSRRSFCNQAMLTSVGLGVAVKVGRFTTRHQSRPLAYPPMKIEGAERLQPGSFLYFNYPQSGDPAVLFRATDGEFVAYSRKCAHLGCSVDADSARQCLKCPCHHGVYDSRTGNVIYGPPPRPLDQIVLQMRAGSEVWAVGKRFASYQSERVVLVGST